tara:strand:- start:282 stop:527 length:246 start_codon:yes stop_codon:yes gene_type:complete
MKNYKAIKAKNNLTLTKESDGSFKITKKAFDPDTGESIDNEVSTHALEFVTSAISALTDNIASLTLEKENYEQLKADMEAL